MEERRRYPRLSKPLDGTWRGQSGASPCRIADISWGGCFIETLSAPSAGERTIVTMTIGDDVFEIEGAVLYIERGMGFAVKFPSLTPAQIIALTTMLGEPPASLI